MPVLLTSYALKCSGNETMTLTKNMKNSFSSVSVMLPLERECADPLVS